MLLVLHAIEMLAARGPGAALGNRHCLIREGHYVAQRTHNDRIVVGDPQRSNQSIPSLTKSNLTL